MSDVLFMFLLTAAMTVALWNPTITWRTGIVTGLLLALATLTRTVSLPLILILAVFLIIRRVRPDGVTPPPDGEAPGSALP
jgi:hypothetical protein